MNFGYNSTVGQNIEIMQISSHPITELNKGAVNLGETCIRGFNFKDVRFTNNTWLHGLDVGDILMFLRLMDFCHTSIPITDEQSGSNKLTYEAKSPEEGYTTNGVLANGAWKELCVGDVTMNPDGEANLKIKRCMGCTLYFDDAVKFNKFKGTIRCEDPNPNIYSFVGNLGLGDEGKAYKYPISPSQILLYDSKLQNTECIYGVLIFTGRDTKVARIQ
ncbi:HAD-like domain-containing protein [Artemisia annua]|uniref:HAD-like domain-containing protein n=1 Tax=Artemisia annua TaxID=35608 RepID=A0A2U1NA81_ARTAN|nr:HAD-like domain-containing protein [Artemisia annua]